MTAFRHIPLVDISGLGDPDPARHAETVEDIRKAASQVGFLYVSGHGIPPETIARLRAAAEPEPAARRPAARRTAGRRTRGLVRSPPTESNRIFVATPTPSARNE